MGRRKRDRLARALVTELRTKGSTSSTLREELADALGMPPFRPVDARSPLRRSRARDADG